MRNEELTRQLDIIPIDRLDQKITIIGAGAIGGWTALNLLKMGFLDLTVYDDDIVAVENLNSQFYRRSDIGKPKVEALKDLLRDFTGHEIKTVDARYEGEIIDGILILAVDNMLTRKIAWDSHVGKALRTKMIIDPRMGAESALLFVNNPLDLKAMESYKNALYSDENAVREPCTAKATVYTASLISGLVCKVVKDIVTDNRYTKTVQWNIKDNAVQMYM